MPCKLKRNGSLLLLAILCDDSVLFATELWPGFVDSGYKNEQVREICFSEEARAILVAPSPDDFDPKRLTLLVIYATPNGNTAEQTLGCQLVEGMDWHYDIQHAAAQWRVFRAMEKDRNIVLACVQANNLSWPTWKGQRAHGPQYIRQIVESLANSLPTEVVHMTLTGHSGGGSFVFGYIDSVEQILPAVERIAFLDANYGYDDANKHGEKILNWLIQNHETRFVVLAYDDRNIELNGKKVVGPTGGTFRATRRMVDFLKGKTPVSEDKEDEFTRYSAVDGRFVALVHPNPKNIILHTRLVGEMNGLLATLTIGTLHQEQRGKLAPPRAYTEHVQPKPFAPSNWHFAAPTLPIRSPEAAAGSELVQELLDATPAAREEVIAREILRGNVPNFWREFVEVPSEVHGEDGQTHKAIYRVSPDYLMIGGDDDFVRVPLTPYTAQLIADMSGCVLPTRKMVDDIYQAAQVKLEPQPLTEDRESLTTFLEHHRLIQEHWPNRQTQQFVAGIKKDVVVTNELSTRPGQIAIYGWHKLDGKPIQPLTTVHVDWYIDYSHGIRLVDQWCKVDGKPMRVHDVLRDEELCGLLSDEGVLDYTSYHRERK